MFAKRFCCAVLSVLIITMLCGCDIFSVNTEQLLSPPALTGDMKPIRQAIDKSVSGEYTLKYPSGGDYRSAVILNDTDADSVFEAFAFYSMRDGDMDYMHINVIRQIDGEWVSVSEQKTEAGGVDRVDFCDLNNDGKLEIIVGWEIYGNTEKQVAVYSLDGNTLSQRLIHSYTSFLCCDLDENGENELFIHLFNPADSSNSALLYGIDSSGAVQISGCAMDTAVKTASEPILSSLSTGKPAIYVNEVKASGSITEVLYMSKGSLINPLLDPKSGENTRTLCAMEFSSKDINNDEITEIPVSELMLSSESKTNSEKVYYIKWCSFNGEKLVNQMTTFFNSADGYYITVPDRWVGNITLERDNEKRSRQIFAYNDKEKKIGAPLAYFIAVPIKDWADYSENDAELTEIVRNDTFVFAGKAYEADTPLGITADELKDMLFLY